MHERTCSTNVDSLGAGYEAGHLCRTHLGIRLVLPQAALKLHELSSAVCPDLLDHWAANSEAITTFACVSFVSASDVCYYYIRDCDR